jgi:hypothetical protein
MGVSLDSSVEWVPDRDGGAGRTPPQPAAPMGIGSPLELPVFEGPKFELTETQSPICVSSPLEIALCSATALGVSRLSLILRVNLECYSDNTVIFSAGAFIGSMTYLCASFTLDGQCLHFRHAIVSLLAWLA